MPARSLLRTASILLLFAGGCDGKGGPPEGGPGATSGQGGPNNGLPVAVQPPEGFRSLEMGQSFLQMNWGPDITDEQLPALKTLTGERALVEEQARTAVTQAEVALTQALVNQVKPDERQAAADAFVIAERKLVEEQISTVVALFDAFTPEQMQTRLRMGYPPILAEMISAHPRTGSGNPFARIDTKLFTDKEKEDTLRRKLDTHAQYLVYQKAMAESVAEVGKLDLSKPGWEALYTAATNSALDGWVVYRKYTVNSLANFIADMRPAVRTEFLLNEGLTSVLKPPERGASTGNIIPSNPNEGNGEVPPGGPGGMGMDGGMGGQGGGMGGQGGGMGGPGMGGQGGGMGGQGGGMGGQGGGMGGQGGGMGGPGGGMGGPGGGMGGQGGGMGGQGGGMGGPPPGGN